MEKWNDWYKLFDIIVEYHGPDEDNVNEKIIALAQIFGSIPEFVDALNRWNEEVA